MKKLFLLTISLAVSLALVSQSSASAVTGFNAGNIIDDSVFTNNTSMNPGQIQTFLNSKVSSCDTQGTQTSEFGGGTRAQWAANASYHPAIGSISPPFTCIKDYSENGRSAAQIIYDVAQQYRINPQVLIVLLQKEQGLITDTWPLSSQYRTATGYGCPDGSACDSQYFGLTNQLKWAGTLFRAVLDNNPNWYSPYHLGANNILWNTTDTNCGSGVVNITNRATVALYDYTPYQPNQAALNAGYGTGDGCSSYGNRNFFLYFRDWFGSTSAQYVALSPPRWMQISHATQKTDFKTGNAVDNTLIVGQQIQFVDKLYVNGKWYLRTAVDQANNVQKGVLIDNIEDIPYTMMDNPHWMQFTVDRYKREPRSNFTIDSQIGAGRVAFFNSQITVNGTTFYRTEGDTAQSLSKGIVASVLGDVPYETFDEPRWMQIKNNTTKVEPRTRTTLTTTLSKGTKLRFVSKINLNGAWYYRTEADTNTSTSAAISASDIEPIPYTPYPNGPYCFQLNTDTAKVHPESGVAVGDVFLRGRQICIAQQIIINGVTYYRTEADIGFGLGQAIPASKFEEVPYEQFATPRWMKTIKNTSKQNAKSGATIPGTINAGQRLYFTSKILIRGQWYYRTEADTQASADATIYANDLVND